MQVRIFNTAFIHSNWDVIGGFIEDALLMSDCDDYSVEQVKVLLVSNKWYLFVAEEDNKIKGCAVVTFANNPNSRTAFITAIGGKFIGNKDTLANFSALLKSMGATKIQGYARESVARLWNNIGFKNKQILVEYKL
jgi:hypothetical protein